MPSMRMRTRRTRARCEIATLSTSNAACATAGLPAAPARRRRLLAALRLRHRVARPLFGAGPVLRPMKPAACPGGTARAMAAQQVAHVERPPPPPPAPWYRSCSARQRPRTRMRHGGHFRRVCALVSEGHFQAAGSWCCRPSRSLASSHDLHSAAALILCA